MNIKLFMPQNDYIHQYELPIITHTVQHSEIQCFAHMNSYCVSTAVRILKSNVSNNLTIG